MSDSPSHGCVVKIIKNYVSTCGGDATLSALIADYHTSFGHDIPYSKFGYKSLIDFLISISGLTVTICGGEHRLKTRWSTNSDSPQADPSTTSSDMSLLCVEMKNNLIFLDSAAKRKVTVKDSNRLKLSKSPLKRYDSWHSVRSEEYVPSSGYCSDTYSTFDHNSSPLTENDYSAFDANNPANETVYSDLTDYGYDSQWQRSYLPETSAYDSSATCGSGLADSTFGYDSGDPFYEHVSANYDGLLYTPENLDFPSQPPEKLDFPNLPPENLDFPNLPPKNLDLPYQPPENLDLPYQPPENLDLPYQPPENLDLPYQPPPVTHKQIVNRLVALVNACQKKIASSAVEYQYIDSYADALPKNWLTLLEESNLLFVERGKSSTLIYPNRTLPSIPTLLDLPKLDLPGRMPWSVSVTSVRSVDSVWFRLNENELDRRYQILVHQMRKHYRSTSPAKILSVEEGQLFAAKFKSRLMRVCVLDRQESGACKCLAIDEGFSEVLPLASLSMLHEKFTNTPKLILQGSLAGLSKYVDCSHVRDRLEKMVVGGDASVVVDKCEAAKFLMNLFVTKADSGSVNVNNYLLEVIEKELSSPKLEIDRIFDVVVLYLSIEDKVAKVQIKSQCLELLRQSLRKCARIIECTDRRLLFAKNVIDVQLNQLYLAKYSDGTWQRVLVKQFVNSTHVVVVFVDFQDIQALEVTKIICYANFPDALTYIPPQGVTVNIVETNIEILKLMNLKLETNSFSMKVVQTDPKIYVQMYLKVPQEARDEGFSNTNCKQFRCSAV